MKVSKYFILAAMLLIASMMIGACAPATPAVEPTEAPAQPTDVAAPPAGEEPQSLTLAIEHFSVIRRHDLVRRSRPGRCAHR